MSPEVVDMLVPRRRGEEVGPRTRKGIFVPQTAEKGKSSVTRATIAAATRLPLLVSSRSNSRSCSPAPSVVEGSTEQATEQTNDAPKRPYLTMASQKARETFNHECIRSCALFADRDPCFVQQLMQDFHIQLFVAGDIIVNEGDQGDTMYFIRRGEVEVCIGEQRTVVRTLSDGSIFGELSLLGVSHTRTATVRALSFCDCRVISHRRFKQILHGFPKEHSFFTQLASDRRQELHKAKRERRREAHREKAKEVVEVAQKRKTLSSIVNSVSERNLVIKAFFPSGASASEPCTRRSSWCPMAFDVTGESQDDMSIRASSACSVRDLKLDLECSSSGSNEDGADFWLASTWPLPSATSQDSCPHPITPPTPKSARHQRTRFVKPRLTIGDGLQSDMDAPTLTAQAPPTTPIHPVRPIRKGQTLSAKASEPTGRRGRSHTPRFDTDMLSEVANLYDMRRVFSPDHSQSPEPPDDDLRRPSC